MMYYIKHCFWQTNISMFKIEKQNKIEKQKTLIKLSCYLFNKIVRYLLFNYYRDYSGEVMSQIGKKNPINAL